MPAPFERLPGACVRMRIGRQAAAITRRRRCLHCSGGDRSRLRRPDQSPFACALKECQYLVLVVALAAPFQGCVSKSKAETQARMAYLAGQRDALLQMQSASRAPSVTFIGPVNNRFVAWSEGLTLTQGIIKAVYAAPTDPAFVVIHRNGQSIQVNPGELLGGKDISLESGDVVEIR